jgi:hypothetical protein
MGTTTKILHQRADGVYDVIHVSMSGYPAHVGRQLLDHHGAAADVDRMFAVGEPGDFSRGSKDLAQPPFPISDIGKVMAGYTFFVFHGDGWRWMPGEAVDTVMKARDAGTPLTHDEVIALTVPLVDAVYEDERPYREAKERREEQFQAARGETGVAGLTADLVEKDGRWMVVLARDDDRIATMTHKEAMGLAGNLATLAGEGEMRRRERDRPVD